MVDRSVREWRNALTRLDLDKLEILEELPLVGNLAVALRQELQERRRRDPNIVSGLLTA